ncbi:MAG: hypothetical protein J1E85_08085 [Ruminococcus sp.]|nr:hypothetical protein [Ruminococcus sp.]
MKKLNRIVHKTNIKRLLYKLERNMPKSVVRLTAVILVGIMVFSLFPVINFNAAQNNSQTKYENISDFQDSRWGQIQSEIFDGVTDIQKDVKVLWNLGIKDNDYFYWNTTDTAGLTKWDGNLSAAMTASGTEKYSYKDIYVDGGDNSEQNVLAEVTYDVFNVSTPAQFRWIMQNCVSSTTYNGKPFYNSHIKINITKDLDFNGMKWEPVNSGGSAAVKREGSIYIEGNGHTLYNLKIGGGNSNNGCGLFGTFNEKLIVKNLGFNSTMMLSDSGISGLIYGTYGRSADGTPHNAMAYIYNVHSDRAYMQSTKGKLGGLVGQTYAIGNVFIKNCSTKNYYAYGTDHISGFMSYTQLATTDFKPIVKYNANMPETPEAFVYQEDTIFPIVVENSYSVDCELFSTGSDSGSFISCGQSIIARNCFTNNTIYATYNTGGFIGRCAYPADSRPGKMYDDAGQYKIGNYFESCYSTGLVEGQTAMGGFTGLDNTYRGLNDIYADPNDVDTNNSLTWPRFGTTADSASKVNDSTDAGATVYKDCYSTAMVGMDYAGKYVGGFVGMDENYTLDTTVNIDGKNVKANGSFYINCFAAGEVGNILTVTNRTTAAKYETEYGKNDEGRNATSEILDYYPTGGFVGVIAPDIYWYDKTRSNMQEFNGKLTTGSRTFVTVLPEEIKEYGFGYFDNCYYDKQTTAMREMEIGMEEGISYRDVYEAKETETFSINGITGVYTESSDVKEVEGLTDFPDGYYGYAMDSAKSNSSVWKYETGYYPQLKAFMLFDFDADGKLATPDRQSGVQLSSSPFYIPEVKGAKDGSESHEVKGFDSETEIITAYRYSQASSATVFLNHWDYKMNTATGGLSTDNDWACAIESNELKFNEKTGFWEKKFTGLESGLYNFKIQANDTMTFNYGKDKFDGENCQLQLPYDNCTVVIKFKYTGLRSSNYQILADIYSESGELLQENIFLGGSEDVEPEKWTLAGDFPDASWDPSNTNYDMQQSNDDVRVYTLTKDFTPKTDDNGEYVPTPFQFKVTKDHGWNESYGVSGGSDNMGFTIIKPCKITFEFNSKTHITKITGVPEDSITDISTEKKVTFDFEGYSVIGQPELTKFNWLESGKELAAAENGKMTETPKDSGIYKVTFDNVKMGNNYAFKVIKDAVDEGANSYFYLAPHPDTEDAQCSVTFTYDSVTKETSVSAIIDSSGRNYAQSAIDAQFFSVLGAEGLTGYHWLGDKDHPTPPQTDESVADYKQKAIANGRMEAIPESSLYRKTFKNIEPGTYGFKVAANGSLDLSFGDNASNENYMITLTEKADVEITFNKETETISVRTTPESALKTIKYVVTGTENLMGKTWDLNDAVMTYNEAEGVYEYTREGVSSGSNYAFKVIEQGKDSGDNISFYLGGSKSKYNIRFTYNPKNGVVLKEAYDIESGADVTDTVIQDVQIRTYSVLGEKGLTGHNWLGLTDNGKPGSKVDESKATSDGLMSKTTNGTYEKTYRNIQVGRNGDIKSYSFKVAANGNWDSGISYGDGNGGNYILSLNGDQSKVSVCDVTIIFDPKTEKITVTTSPADCNLSEIDDTKFKWYVVGDYQLVSYDAFIAGNTVYDTVRDITSVFEFTSGKNSGDRGISWSIDDERNNINNFYEKLGDGTGFSLDYTVDGKSTMTGTFNNSVVDLSVEVIKDEYKGARPDDYISHYLCTDFMPGKQWVSISAIGYGYNTEFNKWKENYIKYAQYLSDCSEYEKLEKKYFKVLGGDLPEKTTKSLIEYMEKLRDSSDAEEISYYSDLVNDYGDILKVYYAITDANKVENPGKSPSIKNEQVIGTRFLRLIPMAYLEAGNDAEINVFQDSRDSGENARNIVKYDKNSSADVTFTGIEDVGFSYYNFAFTSGYAITDKIGLGIFDNYINQNRSDGKYGVKKYLEESLREKDTKKDRTYGTYFAMTSAFTQCASYDDTEKENKGLIADTLVNQSIIGDSYDYNSTVQNLDPNDKNYGQTIVKVYKIDENGNNSKVFMQAPSGDPDETLTTRIENYLKWTGQKKFTTEDGGLYNVVFYWAMSDGRYLVDSKKVTITPLEPGIVKDVDKVYDESGDENTLTYTITYTNTDKDNPVNFAILDVLPYPGDERLNSDEVVGNLKTSAVDNFKFNLKSLKISQSGAATIKGVYYTQNEGVRNYLFDDTSGSKTPSKAAAEKLGVDDDGKIDNSSGYWTNMIRKNVGGGGTYTKEVEGITGIAVSGIQLGVAENISIEITLTYKGTANEFYVNNAFYYAKQTEDDIGINGYTDPVTTTIVGRNINGYVWLDKDLDGFVGETEARIGNVKVSLYKEVVSNDESGGKENSSSKTELIATTTSNENGYYEFNKLLDGKYHIVFSEADDGSNPVIYDGTPGGRKDKKFSELELTKKLIEAEVSDVIGSRSLADVYEKDSNNKPTSYSISNQLPTAEEIYLQTYRYEPNINLDKYTYTKNYQNIGLNDGHCSITLKKVGEDGEPLQGVTFTLEYFDTDSNDWKPIIYDENGFVIRNPEEETAGQNEFKTDSDGLVVFSNLFEGKYRITEISTLEGYNLIPSPIEIELPYKVSKDSQSEFITGNSDSRTEDGDYYYYRDITLTITNTKNINDLLPLTGISGFDWIILLSVVLVITGVIIFLYAFSRKKYHKKSDY